MDKENRNTNSELELWHGTASKNVKSINEQGFNRSFCGDNGTLTKFFGPTKRDHY